MIFALVCILFTFLQLGLTHFTNLMYETGKHGEISCYVFFVVFTLINFILNHFLIGVLS